MSDPALLLFGCVVSFIALAGVYVYLRASFERGTREPVPAHARSRAPQPSLGSAV